MEKQNGASQWKNRMVRRDGKQNGASRWKNRMVHHDGKTEWCVTMEKQNGASQWKNRMVRHDGKTEWCVTSKYRALNTQTADHHSHIPQASLPGLHAATSVQGDNASKLFLMTAHSCHGQNH